MTKTMKVSEKWLLLIYFDYFKILEKIEQESILFTAQKMKFSMKDFFSKCDQIRRTAYSVWLRYINLWVSLTIVCLIQTNMSHEDQELYRYY